MTVESKLYGEPYQIFAGKSCAFAYTSSEIHVTKGGNDPPLANSFVERLY